MFDACWECHGCAAKNLTRLGADAHAMRCGYSYARVDAPDVGAVIQSLLRIQEDTGG